MRFVVFTLRGSVKSFSCSANAKGHILHMQVFLHMNPLQFYCIVGFGEVEIYLVISLSYRRWSVVVTGPTPAYISLISGGALP